MMNNENAKPTTSNATGNNAVVGISPVLYSSKPSTVLVNSWNETRQARAMLDQCRRDKAFAETQLSNEQSKNERLERQNSELQDDNDRLRAHLAAFETENPLPPGWVSRSSTLSFSRHCHHHHFFSLTNLLPFLSRIPYIPYVLCSVSKSHHTKHTAGTHLQRKPAAVLLLPRRHQAFAVALSHRVRGPRPDHRQDEGRSQHPAAAPGCPQPSSQLSCYM